jgi:flagellar biosynthetic protein FliR
MKITIDSMWIFGTLLTSIRLGPLFLAAPGMGSLRIPLMARGLFVVALSAMLSSIWFSAFKSNATSNIGALFVMALSELFVGATLAFGLIAGFAAFQFGGRIIDLQIGFGIANVFDPVTRAQTPLLGSALQLAALMVFFMVDGHLFILRGIAFSLERIPLGTPFTDVPIPAIAAQFGAMFTFGLAVVAPVMMVLLLLDVGLATISRSMPQVNVFFVTIPIKVFVGLVVLAVSTQYMGPVMRRVFEAIFEYWQTVLG